MAAKTTKALNMELMALAPECEGSKSQELENLVYRLPGVRKAEYDATDTECKRLQMEVEAAKAGQAAPKMAATNEAMKAAKEESDTVVTELVTLAMSWKGEKGGELSALAKQLPCAVKAERTTADARMERLREELAALLHPSYGEDVSRWKANQLGGTTQTSEGETGNGKAPPSAPVAMRTPGPPAHAPVSGRPHPETEARQLRRASTAPHPPSPLGPRQPDPPAHAAARRAFVHDQARSDDQWRAVLAGKASPLQSDPHYQAYALQPHASQRDYYHQAEVQRMRPVATRLMPPPVQSPRALQSSSATSGVSWPPSADPYALQPPAANRSDSLPPPSKRRKVVEQSTRAQKAPARPTCGNCNFKNKICNSQARCQHCESRRCVYILCEKGSTCTSRKCNRLHPGQWESGDAEGRQYLIKGVNIFD
ncbi:hypothetical protein LTR85_008016 [Meristemomyces frigidus]|nr:hypothetical protein LTR85_008016 [Meristemomyces frigidus]